MIYTNMRIENEKQNELKEKKVVVVKSDVKKESEEIGIASVSRRRRRC